MSPAGTGFGSWMKKLDGGEEAMAAQFASAGQNAFDPMKLPESDHEIQMKELQQEMKVLHWHKLANEAALKAALIRTKRLKEKEGAPVVENKNHRIEKVAWMRRIIEDEQRKPLEVNEEFIREFAERERKEQDRYEREMERHVKNLKKVKSGLKNREEIRKRNHIYKHKKKMLNDYIAKSRASDYGSDDLRVEDLTTGESVRFPSIGGDQAIPGRGRKSSTGAPLNKVIQSLDKLVDLEKRISSLEDGMGGGKTSQSARNNRGPISFAKKQTKATLSRPSKTTYQVKVKTNAIARNKQRKKVSKRGGAFLTSIPDDNMSVTSKRSVRSTKSTRTNRSHTRAKTLYGTKKKPQSVRGVSKKPSIRSRSQTRAKPRRGRARNTQSVPPQTRRNPRSVGKGNKSAKDHLKQFNEIRRQFDKKKVDLNRSLHSQPKVVRKPIARSNTSNTRRVPLSKRAPSSRTTRANRSNAPTKRRRSSTSVSSRRKSHAKANTKGLGIYGNNIKSKRQTKARSTGRHNAHLPRLGG